MLFAVDRWVVFQIFPLCWRKMVTQFTAITHASLKRLHYVWLLLSIHFIVDASATVKWHCRRVFPVIIGIYNRKNSFLVLWQNIWCTPCSSVVLLVPDVLTWWLIVIEDWWGQCHIRIIIQQVNVIADVLRQGIVCFAHLSWWFMFFVSVSTAWQHFILIWCEFNDFQSYGFSSVKSQSWLFYLR